MDSLGRIKLTWTRYHQALLGANSVVCSYLHVAIFTCVQFSSMLLDSCSSLKKAQPRVPTQMMKKMPQVRMRQLLEIQMRCI